MDVWNDMSVPSRRIACRRLPVKFGQSITCVSSLDRAATGGNYLRKQNVRGIGDTTSERSIGHDHDDCVFFHVEWAGIQIPFYAKSRKGAIRHDLYSNQSTSSGDMMDLITLCQPLPKG